MKQVCVFCGSRMGTGPVYREAARALGQLLASRGLGLVFGGGHIGLMGVLADAVLDRGGEVIGVIPQGLVDRELAHPRSTKMHVTASMHERKALMAQLADAFVALPGGFGTFDETFEMLTWAQLGLHHKPIGLLNVEGFFDGLLTFLDHTVQQGFVKPLHRHLLLKADTPHDLLETLAAAKPLTLEEKWSELPRP
jgi:uncharacterized protein (TIGR00730 family)